MPKRTIIDTSDCPVAKSADVIGDRWTMLILRELFFGQRRFEQFEGRTGASPQMLADRLRHLAAKGIIVRETYQERPTRYQYALTDKGKDLFSVLYAMRNWAERWERAEDTPLAINYIHRACGHDVGLETSCPHCGDRLGYGDLKGTPNISAG
jgi:DNA-binding HxlR family transcriptional regulator